MQKNRPLLVLTALVAVDMVIKLIINCFFMESQFVIGDVIGFKPHLNTTQLSIFNNELSLGVSTGVLIALNIVFIPIILLSYRWVDSSNELGHSFIMSEDMLLAGAICSLLDKVFWGGSLDYIYLLSRWIIDLKDIYLFGAVCAFMVSFCHAVRIEINKRKK